MDEIRNRLLACFSAVFPLLSPSELESAESSQLPAWDSVASVTLFATIEEEFATEIDVNNMAELLSFKKLEEYLRERSDHRPLGE